MYRARTMKIIGNSEEGWSFQILEEVPFKEPEVIYESKRSNNQELTVQRGIACLNDAHEAKPIHNDTRAFGSF